MQILIIDFDVVVMEVKPPSDFEYINTVVKIKYTRGTYMPIAQGHCSCDEKFNVCIELCLKSTRMPTVD